MFRGKDPDVEFEENCDEMIILLDARCNYVLQILP